MTDATHIAPRSVVPFGKYYLVEKIAEGGMAEIFLAKQLGVEGFEKNVVIKRMLKQLSSSPEFVTMFLDEARLAATLQHPNIVHIGDLGIADGCYYISMEFLAGEDFASVLRTARQRDTAVPLHISLRVIAEAARGLHFAHEHVDGQGRPLNIVHRDISPSNLFITYAGSVKVLDFGIAKAESTITQTGAGVVKGKYQYMSPEQALGDRVDRRSDVYALGVSLYEALTLTRPFARDHDLAILKAVLEGQFTPLEQLRPDLPPAVIRIVGKAMATDVVKRFQTAAELASALEGELGRVTTASGGSSLSTFMHAFFGASRVQARSRIPTLRDMSESGVDVPALGDPGLKTTADVVARSTELHSSRTERRTVPRSRLLAGIAIGAVLTLALGLGVGLLARGKSVEAVDAGLAPAVPVAVVDPVRQPVEPQVEDAGAVLPAVDAGPPPPVAVATPKKKVVLTADVVKRVLTVHSRKLQSCFSKHRDELPSAKGRVLLKLHIESSGRVTEVELDLPPASQLSACLVRASKDLRFPAHVDSEVIVPMPLSYDIRASE